MINDHKFSFVSMWIIMNLMYFARRLATTVSWKAAYLVFVTLSFSVYLTIVVVNDHYAYHTSWYERPAPCRIPKETVNQMVKLSFLVSELLTMMNISHGICYGTLWGALRNKKMLPWDNNIDFCVFKSEMKKVSFSSLQKHFKSQDLDISYDYRHGEYTVVSGPAVVVINVFYVTMWKEVLHEGWEYRFLWFFQEQPLSFPKRLLESPMNRISFHNGSLPAPHDNLEMLKYLYKHDWWLEKAPPGCS